MFVYIRSDKGFFSDLIVTQSREIRQKQQVLVVTHNANIVVNGDAGKVIALDIRSGQTRIVTQTALKPTIRDEIYGVMEGGREAFTINESVH